MATLDRDEECLGVLRDITGLDAAATTAPSRGKGRSAKVMKFLGAASTVVASAASGPSMSAYSWEVT